MSNELYVKSMEIRKRLFDSVYEILADEQKALGVTDGRVSPSDDLELDLAVGRAAEMMAVILMRQARIDCFTDWSKPLPCYEDSAAVAMIESILDCLTPSTVIASAFDGSIQLARKSIRNGAAEPSWKECAEDWEAIASNATERCEELEAMGERCENLELRCEELAERCKRAEESKEDFEADNWKLGEELAELRDSEWERGEYITRCDYLERELAEATERAEKAELAEDAANVRMLALEKKLEYTKELLYEAIKKAE